MPLTARHLYPSEGYNPSLGMSDSDQYCEIPETKGVNSYVQVWVPKGALCGLELHEVKVSRAVLMGACGLLTILWGGNAPRLPDPTRA